METADRQRLLGGIVCRALAAGGWARLRLKSSASARITANKKQGRPPNTSANPAPRLTNSRRRSPRG
jgi:hypothetical protein